MTLRSLYSDSSMVLGRRGVEGNKVSHLMIRGSFIRFHAVNAATDTMILATFMSDVDRVVDRKSSFLSTI